MHKTLENLVRLELVEKTNNQKRYRDQKLI